MDSPEPAPKPTRKREAKPKAADVKSEDAFSRLDPDSPPGYWESSGYSLQDWRRVCAYYSAPKPDVSGKATVTQTPVQQPNPFLTEGVPLASPGAILGLKVWSA
jgi:hypothetical protein